MADTPVPQDMAGSGLQPPASGLEAAPMPTFEQPAAEPTPWPGRHLFIAITGTSLDADTRALLSEIKPGGVALRQENLADRTQSMALIEEIKKAVGFGAGIADLPLVAVSQEGGDANVLGLKEAPSAADLGRKGDAEAAREIGRNYAAEASARGIGVLFAPVLDVYDPSAPDPAWAARTFGSDRGLVTAIGLALADGIMAGGAIPVAKAFPGRAAAQRDAAKPLPILRKDVHALAELLYPFSEAAARGIPGMIVGHVAAPTIDKSVPARPASLSPPLVTGVLREYWGFNNVVLSDDLVVLPSLGAGTVDGAAVHALAAGCDALILLDPSPAVIHSVCTAIEKALAGGVLAPDRLDASKKRLDSWQAWLRKPTGLTSPPPPVPESFRTPPLSVARTPELPASATPAVPPTPEPAAAAPETPTPPAPPAVEPAVQSAQENPEPAPSEKATPTPQPAEGTPSPEEPAPSSLQPPASSLEALAPAVALTPEPPTPASTAQAVAPSPEPPVPVPPVPTVVSSPEPVTPVPPAPGTPVTPEPAAPAPPTPMITSTPEPPTPQPARSEAAVAPTAEPPTPAPPAQAVAPTPEPSAPSGLQPPASSLETLPPTAPPGTEEVRHEVQRGETLSRIAQKYGVKMPDLMTWNNLQNADIRAGQKLIVYVIPGTQPQVVPETSEATEIYRVAPGDTVTQIAARYGITRQQLLEMNGLTDPNKVVIGQRLKIPKK